MWALNIQLLLMCVKVELYLMKHEKIGTHYCRRGFKKIK